MRRGTTRFVDGDPEWLVTWYPWIMTALVLCATLTLFAL